MNMQLPQVERRVTLGSVINGFLIVCGFVAAGATYVANSQTAETLIKTRVDTVEIRTSGHESRLVAVETSINFIRESVVRIENAVAPKR